MFAVVLRSDDGDTLPLAETPDDIVDLIREIAGETPVVTGSDEAVELMLRIVGDAVDCGLDIDGVDHDRTDKTFSQLAVVNSESDVGFWLHSCQQFRKGGGNVDTVPRDYHGRWTRGPAGGGFPDLAPFAPGPAPGVAVHHVPSAIPVDAVPVKMPDKGRVGGGFFGASPDAKTVVDAMHILHPHVEIELTEHKGGDGDYWQLSRLVVPKDRRGHGEGTKVMKDLTAAADLAGMPITLTPEPIGGGSRKRLVRFYQDHGFVKNKGRHKLWSSTDSMVRYPGMHAAAQVAVAGLVARLEEFRSAADVPRDYQGQWCKGAGCNAPPDIGAASLSAHAGPVSGAEAAQARGLLADAIAAADGDEDARADVLSHLNSHGPASTEAQYDRLLGDNWTAGRNAQHKEIVDQVFAENASVPRDGKAIMAGGLPGAGKSSAFDNPDVGIDKSQYLHIDADDIKQRLLDRNMIERVPGMTDGEHAALIHEESTRIVDLVTARALKEKRNIILDKTMAWPPQEELAMLRKNGYAVTGVFVDIPVHESQFSARERWKGGGRFIPPAYIASSSHPTETSKNLKQFKDVSSEFDEWIYVDNRGIGTPRRKPRGTVRRGSGVSTGFVSNRMRVFTSRNEFAYPITSRADPGISELLEPDPAAVVAAALPEAVRLAVLHVDADTVDALAYLADKTGMTHEFAQQFDPTPFHHVETALTASAANTTPRDYHGRWTKHGGGEGRTIPGVGDVDEYIAANPRGDGEELFVWQGRLAAGLPPESQHALMFEIREQYEPVDYLSEGVTRWREEHGLPEPQTDISEIPANQLKSYAVARAYEMAPDQSNDPKVQKAFGDFKAQNDEMYDYMTRPESEGGLGVKVEFWTSPDPSKFGVGPYPDARAQAEDLRVNHHIFLESGLGGEHSATMSRDEYDRFRAVHDVFGHAAIGGGFDRHGEYQAYLVHSSMYTGDGRRAMASEYHGVNSAAWSGMPGTPGTGKSVLLPEALIANPWDEHGRLVPVPTRDVLEQYVPNLPTNLAVTHVVFAAADTTPRDYHGRWTKHGGGGQAMPSAAEFDRMEKVGGPLGSNGGQWYRDDTGQKYLVKPAQSREHAENELAAGLTYEHLGVPVNGTGIFERDGDWYVSKKAVDGDIVGHNPTADIQMQARQGFAADTLTSSWDTYGLVGDNTLIGSDGQVYRIDVGGSNMFRAQGGNKDSFNPGREWVEPFSMRSSNQGRKLYGDFGDREAATQLAKLQDVNLDALDANLRASGISDAVRTRTIATYRDRIDRQLPGILAKMRRSST